MTDYGLITDYDPFARIEAESVALAEAADGNLGAPVPTCPGWSVADLVWHLAEVQQFWATIVAGSLQDPAEVVRTPRPADGQLTDELRAGSARLIDALRGAAPEEPVWTWASRRDAGFVVRHQVHEAAVHRHDAERAAGREHELDPVVATDGVEEYLAYVTPFRVDAAAPMGGRLELAATDTGFRWLVAEDGMLQACWQRLDAGTDPAADAVLAAPASELLLCLHGRRPVGELPVSGDVGVLARFGGRNDNS